MAVENGASPQDIQLMMDAGYPVDSVTPPKGNSLLSTAVRYGHIRTAELLIHRGADVIFVKDRKLPKRTPIICASVHGYAGACSFCLTVEPSHRRNALRM